MKSALKKAKNTYRIMKKMIGFFSILCLLLITNSYAQIDTLRVAPIEKVEYYPNTSISLKDVYGHAYITPAQQKGITTFYVQYTHGHNKAIMDDEFTELWYFMIPATAKKSFILTGDNLALSNAVYCKLCYCMDAGCKPAAKDWVISGKKKCKKWIITLKKGEDINYTFTAKPEVFEKFPK